MKWAVPDGASLHRVTSRTASRNVAKLAEVRIERTSLYGSAPESGELADHELDGVLTWTQHPWPPGPTTSVKPTPSLLFVFARLADQHPKRYLDFARRYGPLDLCRHGKPASHVPWAVMNDLARPYVFENTSSSGEGLDFSDEFLDRHGGPEQDRELPSALVSCRRKPFASERISSWRRYAQQAAAMIDILGELSESRPVPVAHWLPLADLDDEPLQAMVLDRPQPPRTDRLSDRAKEVQQAAFRQESRDALDTQRTAIAGFVDQWLHLGGVRPAFTWGRAGFSLDLIGEGSLFAALALQLADLVHNPEEALLRCSECGRSYKPRRRPRQDQDNFCNRKVCQEARKKRYRQRRRRS